MLGVIVLIPVMLAMVAVQGCGNVQNTDNAVSDATGEEAPLAEDKTFEITQDGATSGGGGQHLLKLALYLLLE